MNGSIIKKIKKFLNYEELYGYTQYLIIAVMLPVICISCINDVGFWTAVSSHQPQQPLWLVLLRVLLQEHWLFALCYISIFYLIVKEICLIKSDLLDDIFKSERSDKEDSKTTETAEIRSYKGAQLLADCLIYAFLWTFILVDSCYILFRFCSHNSSGLLDYCYHIYGFIIILFVLFGVHRFAIAKSAKKEILLILVPYHLFTTKRSWKQKSYKFRFLMTCMCFLVLNIMLFSLSFYFQTQNGVHFNYSTDAVADICAIPFLVDAILILIYVRIP